MCLLGLTHASVWAAGCSYMTLAVPVDNRPTAQMILHSLHHAFGRGCGALIGGAIINKYGMLIHSQAYLKGEQSKEFSRPSQLGARRLALKTATLGYSE